MYESEGGSGRFISFTPSSVSGVVVGDDSFPRSIFLKLSISVRMYSSRNLRNIKVMSDAIRMIFVAGKSEDFYIDKKTKTNLEGIKIFF